MALCDRVLEVLQGGRQMTAQQVWMALDEADTRRTSVNNALQSLFKRGLVHRDASHKEHIYSMDEITKARPSSHTTTLGSLHDDAASSHEPDQGARLAARLREIFEQLENLKREKLEILKMLENI